jgi:hypothetical protein
MSVTLTSPLGNIWICIQNQLATVSALNFIDLDTGQLEYLDKQQRPQVLLPCALFDFIKDDYRDLSFNAQQAEAILEIRIGVNPYTQATNYFTDTQKENALQFFEIENQVNLALQGWSNSQYFGPLSRISAHTEKRGDKIRVRILRYKFTYIDATAIPVETPFTTNGFVLNVTGQGTGIGG